MPLKFILVRTFPQRLTENIVYAIYKLKLL